MAGISLEACDCRLWIRYVDDMRFTCYTFGGMDSWVGLTLSVGSILPMDIFLQLKMHLITFGSSFLCLAFQLVHDFMIF